MGKEMKIRIILNVFMLLCIVHNVRRYVALAQSRGGACFCTRGAMQGYDFVLFIVALPKTVTPVGAPGGSRGRPWRQSQNCFFSYSIVAPRSANDIYRPVMRSCII